MSRAERRRIAKEGKIPPIGNTGPNRAQRRRSIKGGRHSDFDRRLAEMRDKA